MALNIIDIEARVHNLEILIQLIYLHTRKYLPEDIRQLVEDGLKDQFEASGSYGAYVSTLMKTKEE